MTRLDRIYIFSLLWHPVIEDEYRICENGAYSNYYFVWEELLLQIIER